MMSLSLPQMPSAGRPLARKSCASTSVSTSRSLSSGRLAATATPAAARTRTAAQRNDSPTSTQQPDLTGTWLQRASLAALTASIAGPAAAEDFSAGNISPGYWVTLGLFVMTVPGLWSLVKRAPTSKVVRKTYTVPGPAVEGSPSLDQRAVEVFSYFQKYNYDVKEMGETITFKGTFEASQGQGLALTFYVFVCLLCCGLVLSITAPEIGNWWYALSLISPAAYTYYMSRGTREEEIQVKMITTDDDATTEIKVQGDSEEIERFWRELDLTEKGMVKVPGLL